MQGWGMTWDEALERSRRRPVMFVGKPETAHLTSVLDAVYCACGVRAFQSYLETRFTLSPNQYVVETTSGALLPIINSLVKWDETQHIMDAFAMGRLNLAPHEETLTPEQRYFYLTVGPAFIAMMRPLLLADYFVTSIQGDSGYYFQSYSQGVSTGKPLRIQGASPKGLIIASAIDKRWFTGLPYEPEDVSTVLEVIGKSGDRKVEGIWCPVDNRAFDISNNLNNINYWLGLDDDGRKFDTAEPLLST